MRLAFGIAGMIACFTLPDVSALPDAIAWIIPFCLFVTFLLNVIGTIVLPAMVSRQSLEVGRVRLTLRELPAFVHDS